MGKCVIFCAGDFDGLAAPLDSGDYLIAADGGVRHLERLGREPDAILGDFDSLGYIPRDAVVFPVEKDDTDSMLALRHGLAMGFREFWLYGALDGRRLDHALANFQALQFLRERDARGWLIGRDTLVTVIRGERALFPANADGILSVFCLGADARGVTIRGLKYPLEGQTLSSAFPLGVSNHFIRETAEISVAEGCLLLMWGRENGFPTISDIGDPTSH